MIGIVVTNFLRVEILRIFCAGVARLRYETGLPIPTVCVGGEEGKQICEFYNITHITYPNRPLTYKFNRACEELRGKVDHIMIMGSDNLLATESFLAIQAEADKGIDLIGLDSVYFFAMDDVHTGKLIPFKNTKVLGVARTVSKRVLDIVGWRPWGEVPKDRSIDTHMLDIVRPLVKSSSLLSDQYVFDLKTKFNLNPVRFWAEKLGTINPDILWSHIGQKETMLINNYLENEL